MKIEMPYGRGHLSCELPDDAAVIRSRVNEMQSDDTGEELVRRAMASPIGAPRLSELARGKRDAVVIISDHTRPVPSREILPEMLSELRQGNPEIDVTLLVATGCHRETTEAELRAKLGEIYDRERVVVHDAFDPAKNVKIGVLPSGAELVIDRLAAETELLVAEGFIEPHFFAGFSGGRKSVLPGVCDRVTVLGNHCGAFIHDPRARTGILDGNPIHIDMTAAAKMARLAFIVNVVVNDDHRTVAAFAGEPETAHRAGADFAAQYARVAPIMADIVLTSNGGVPFDQNIYQCVKALSAAEATVRPGGTVILCAEAADGIGGEGFYRSLRDCESPAALYRECTETPQNATIPDQWQSQILARILMHCRVIFVSSPEVADAVREMKMEYAETIEEALAMAGEGSITVIPNGISVIMG